MVGKSEKGEVLKSCMCSGNSNIDSYIEMCFYEQCIGENGKIKVFYEWQANKERYIKTTDTTVLEFQNYSLHDRSHSQAIINAIEKLLGRKRINRLGIGDLWLILNAAYAHDIGMATKYEEISDIWRSDENFHRYLERLANQPELKLQEEARYYMQLHNLLNDRKQMEGLKGNRFQIVELSGDWPVRIRKNVMILTNEYIRKEHAKRSQKYLTRFTEALGAKVAIERLYLALGKIACAHNEDFQYIFEFLDPEADGFGGDDKIHPQFIAILLRLGDLLDMDNDRFDPFVLAHFGDLPNISKGHYQRHLDLTHQLINERTIEATERTEDIEVARLALAWFRSIEEEMKNFTSSWNRTAPEELGGCCFDRCDLKVYLNGELYTQKTSDKFTVDEKKFMDILIGDKLYNKPFVFVREYIQNAMDAAKMLLNIRLDAEWGRSGLVTSGREYLGGCPLELNRDYLEELAVTVGISMEGSLDSGGEKIRMTFQDHGIGMEPECFDTISVIGSGWRGRKKYRETLVNTRFWLCPTGGFGVGLQSGFMATDEIGISTRGYQEQQGYQLTLSSPRVGGKIDVLRSNKKLPIGTIVCLDVEKEQMIDLIQKSELEEISSERDVLVDFESEEQAYPSEQKSYLRPDLLLKKMAGILVNYISSEIPNCLFPIVVTYPGKNGLLQKQEIRGRVLNVLRNGECKYDEEFNCLYQWQILKQKQRENKSCLCLWDYSNRLYAEICVDWGHNSDVVCHRGIRLDDFMEARYSETRKYISDTVSIFMDCMDEKAEEWLLISRSGFQPGVKAELRRMAMNVFRFYMKLLLESDSLDYAEAAGTALFTGIVLFGSEWEASMAEKLGKVKQELDATYLSWQKEPANSGKEKEQRTGVHIELSKKFTAEKLFEIIRQGGIVLWKIDDTDRENDRMDRVTNYLWENIERESDAENCSSMDIISAQIRSDMGLWIIEKNRNAFSIKCNSPLQTIVSINSDSDKFQELNGIFGCMQFSVPRQERMSLTQLLEEAFQRERDYIVIDDAEDYSALLIGRLPSGSRYDVFCSEKNVVLLPIESLFFDTLRESYHYSKISWDDFWDKVQEAEIWKYAVDWTLRHPQNEKSRNNRKTVIDQYRKLCTYVFELIKSKRRT